VDPRNDIAIYSPFAFIYYEDRATHADRVPHGGGGAELQTTLLARALAQRGLRVAHIVYRREHPAEVSQPGLELVEREPWAGRRGLRGKVAEAIRVWRALKEAHARLYVFRGGGAHLIVGAAFCALHRRRLVLSTSNDLDFIFDRPDRSRWGQALYRAALRRSRLVVVQTAQQARLARDGLGSGTEVRVIPSFAEQPGDPETRPEPEPEAFLWAARVVEYKLPLRYVELARAVPEARFRMVAPWTSDTPKELLEEVTEAAGETPNLEFMPHQWRQAVLRLMERSTAVVVTSEHEGMPNVFLEAWARGIPVISLHFDPDGRIAGEGLGLIADGSWEEFVAAVRRLWTDPELRRQIGERARRYVAREHSPEAVGKRWAAALREALS
jgi:glycosyltransferase involved in cell wall biosynthesis